MTPRPGLDTGTGRNAGLSTFITIDAALGRADNTKAKAQAIDISRLRPPLQGVLDDPLKGHVSILSVTDEGTIDFGLLEEWAASRETEHTHFFTRIVLDAIVEPDVRRERG